MGKTLEVAKDRAFDQTKTVLPAEIARGVYLRNAPSLQALKLMHLMISKAGGRMADDVRHEVRLSEIRAIDGMKNHDRASLTPLFEELRAAVIREGNPEDDESRVIIGGFLDQAILDRKDPISGDTLLSWYFGRMFRDLAEKSNYWAILDRQTIFHLNSKYSVLLFQHIASLVNLDKISSKTFTVQELRALFGLPEGKIKRFANLRKDILDTAITEINQLSRLDLTAKTNKVGRTVASVTISWQKKDDPSLVKKELQSHSSGRKARRDNTVDTVTNAFPATGGIDYDHYWIGLKRMANCNMDNTMIADKFRAFCRDKSIPLDSRNIENIFSGFCKKIGNVS